MVLHNLVYAIYFNFAQFFWYCMLLDWDEHRLTSWTIWFLLKQKKVIKQRKFWRWVNNFPFQMFSLGSNHALTKAILKMLVETLELSWIGNEYSYQEICYYCAINCSPQGHGADGYFFIVKIPLKINLRRWTLKQRNWITTISNFAYVFFSFNGILNIMWRGCIEDIKGYVLLILHRCSSIWTEVSFC